MRTCHRRNETRRCDPALAPPPRGGPSPFQQYSRRVDHHQAWQTAGWLHARSVATDTHVILSYARNTNNKIN